MLADVLGNWPKLSAFKGLSRGPPCFVVEVCCDRRHCLLRMASNTVSFRITRNTEDLAQTIHLLSQRLVKLEHRLAAMELQLDRHQDPDPSELTRLDNVEVLLEECRQLLDLDLLGAEPIEDATAEPDAEMKGLSLAA